jgi:hypothetical protein
MKKQKDLVTEGRKIHEKFLKRVNEGFFDKIKSTFKDSEDFTELLTQFSLKRDNVLKNTDGTVNVGNLFFVDGSKEWLDADKKGLALAVKEITGGGRLQIRGIKGQPTPFKLERWPKKCSEIIIDNCDLVSFDGFSNIGLTGVKVEVSNCENLKSLNGLGASVKTFMFMTGDFKNFEEFGDFKPAMQSIPGTSKMAVDALKENNNDVKAAEEALKTKHGFKIIIRMK